MSQGLVEEQFTSYKLKAHASETADETGSTAVPVVDAKRVMAVIDISAVTGTAATLLVNIEGRDSTADAWEDAIQDPAEPDAVKAATVGAGTALQATGAQIAKVSLRPFKTYRYTSDLGGTTPDWTYGIHLHVETHRRAVAAQLLG